MKSKTLTLIAALTLSAATLAVPVETAWAGSSAKPPVLYVVEDLGTLGGSGSDALGVNEIGWVSGVSSVSGDQSGHAFLWRDGVMGDLGTLGGKNSDAFYITNNGLIAGAAETASADPLQENFCLFALLNQGNGQPTPPTGLICRAVFWRDGVINELPTLGGANGQATDANSRGQVVGWAETSTQDPTCVAPQALDYYGVVWGPKAGEIQALPPLPGDKVSLAGVINERGQVAGQSGPCINPNGFLNGVFLPHGVIWEQGHATSLGSLGGAHGDTFPYNINNRGQVVGQSNLPGDAAFHAFLWQKGVMADLGVLQGDVDSLAFGVNDRGQVVGTSIGATLRAFLWQNGVMTDLNTLIKGSTSLDLIFANGINSRGEIAGQAFDSGNGEFRAFLAIPCDEDHANDAGCKGGSVGATAASAESNARPWLPSPSPQGIRALLQQRLSGGLGAGLMRPH
jgi:probable HAF family extracellular repeat protein